MTSPLSIAFPLKQEQHEVRLENLEEGVYLICAEAIRSPDNVILEKECFYATVIHVSDNSGKS